MSPLLCSRLMKIAVQTLHSKVLSMQPMYFLTNISVQFLRLVHSVCDHHPNKYLLLSRNELEELKHNNNDNPNIDKIIQSNLHCAESEGQSKIYENIYSLVQFFHFQFRFIIEYFVSDERSRRDVHAEVLDCPSRRVLSKRANLQTRPGKYTISNRRLSIKKQTVFCRYFT